MTKRKTIEPLEDYLNAPFEKARKAKKTAEDRARYAAAVSKAQANIRAMLTGEPKQ